MGRLLFFALLAGVLWLLFKRWKSRAGFANTTPESQLPKVEQTIYPCRLCGAYSPLSAGVMLQGRFYCNAHHAKAAGERVKV
ncbi:MAG: hypothetical protein HC848_00515 [Limnobacter sp.]|nr:hypothetical protein [Limnobacter sp.]